jgi:4'-phosphopantetheinyl transferase
MANSRGLVLDLWLISCEAADENGAYNILDEQERRRADAFLSPQHRRRFVHAHAGLRQILHRYTGVHPAALRFASGKSGKPYLENLSAAAPNFNLSHSGELAVVAVGNLPEIGVDIEVIRPMPDWEELARMSFHPSESEWVGATAAHRRAEAFFRVWTAKEAYIKASGRGMSHPLPSFAVVGAATQQEYVITSLELPAGYAGAVAHPPPECEVRVNWWSKPDSTVEPC